MPSWGLLLLVFAGGQIPVETPSKPRLIVLTDIGGDPDDQQSLIRLMVYSNELAIEGLIATAAGTPGELKKPQIRPDLIREIVGAFGKVRPHLERHAQGWPTEKELLDCIKEGNPKRGLGEIGPGKDTQASEWLVKRIDASTPDRPLNVAIWGGQTDLGQALWRIKNDQGEKGITRLALTLRVFDINDQDGLASWIQREFPSLHYILSSAPQGKDKRLGTYRGMYLGGNESLTSREWVEKWVKSTGPLGQLYPTRCWTAPNPHGCLKEGDTPSWFFFLPRGGNDPRNPSQPGWGGVYRKSTDGFWRDLEIEPGKDPRDTVSRWRPVFQEDFARRMAWTRP